MSGSFVPFDKLVFSMEDYPCPRCGNRLLVGLLYRADDGYHMNTYYKCMYWPRGDVSGGSYQGRERCGWEGWRVPKSEDPDEEELMPPEPKPSLDSGLVTIKSHPSLDERVQHIERTMKERGLI